ncbi:RagB/SusD family nutrient uptake outer membrane protein [Dysgonomonas sp. BGC7]|uniref:RagB/SusD family nutrient uptake outer membrane protein n=1 Tax=Dysgonomonas sp. BGC7 TaxID=1658008 RepID=UPI0006806BEF|nr:RagB/SusD family nutrient uptake outer membrane protein [Dysgonomonas sp. BGC7]MBD8387141.1 RagB/SusD family nutrient uptake outer membrane protein [Dysgonomonas sp. BGC7]
MKKRNLLYTIGLSVAMLISSSCNDYLDRDDNDQITEKEAFSRYEKVNEMVTDVYAAAKKANRPLVFFEHFSSSAITDECEGTNVEGNITNNFNNGAWNPNSLPGSSGQYWWNLYEGIRKTNLIIENVVKYNTPDNPLQDGELSFRIGEVYFMRAYFHLLLFRMYGEAPYINWKIEANESMNFKKESVHAMVEKMVADAEEAYRRVPAKYVKTSPNFGRIDKGACLGLISIARWMAATPLWNGAKTAGYPQTRVFESEYGYDKKRWEAARDAAKAVLDYEVGGYKRYALYTKYTSADFDDPNGGNLNDSRVYKRLWDMFFDMDAFAGECVFFITKDKDQAWQGDVYPPSRGGSSRQQPVQEQVDEYEYIVGNYGYPIYSSEARKAGYDDANPYERGTRDPRFYRDIIYHGAPYRDNSNNAKTMNTASGSDAIGASNATTTGYYLRKLQKESWNNNSSFSVNAPAIWRLPEFIYIYAEAVNELGEADKIAEAYNLVNSVRERSFMKPMPPEVKTDKALMFQYIQRERRVEFFYENKRPWSCRLYLEPNSRDELSKESQWKASGTDNSTRTKNYWASNYGSLPKCQRMINGMRPVKKANGKIVISGENYAMERFCVEERVFQSQHYLFPIMQSELQRTPSLIQNPGW